MNRIFYRALSLMQRMYNSAIIRLFGCKGQILVFHEILDNQYISQFDSCVCSLNSFDNYIRKHRENICTLCQMLQEGNPNNIVITFDDVPESVYKYAYPLLCELSIPFILYITPSFLDKDGFLTTAQLLEMSKNPLCEVGAHTMNHPILRESKDLWSEIYDSKIYIEQIIGKKVHHLAYPYGRADSVGKQVRQCAKATGFKTAVCTIPTKVPDRCDFWYIPRQTLK